ncbi:MAG: hypothetical protein IJO70_02850 [Lachnospiraceae bacterium]|nr:hypothetical protein [Lachnospiraceae bacterium]
MSFIKRFLRLRKQDDRVKIMLVLGIIAMVCLIFVIKNTVTMYNYVNSPTEYELMGNLTSDLKLKELSQLESVKMISLQGDMSASVRYNMNETSVGYMVLSADYASYVYGVKDTTNMTTLYANSLAYEQLLKALSVDRYIYSSVYEAGELVLEYKAGDKEYTSAKVVLVGELPDDEPFVFAIENSVDLKNKANKLRVYVSKQDMEQMIIKEFESRGYFISDKEILLEFQNQLDKLVIDIKYQVIICIMSILWIFTLHRISKI